MNTSSSSRPYPSIVIFGLRANNQLITLKICFQTGTTKVKKEMIKYNLFSKYRLYRDFWGMGSGVVSKLQPGREIQDS